MATTQAVWGIDLGRCALKAIKLRQAANGKVEILGHDYIEHAKILSQPDADRHELIAGALEKFLSRNDISKDLVVVSVPGQHTLARFTKLPPVAPKRIPDIVRYEADQQIPFDMDEVIWDYQIFEQEDLPDVEVGIFAMKRELLREHLLHFEQAAIEPIAVQPCPLALYNTAQFDGMLAAETTVLLDIGAENADLIVATRGSLWTRTIPIGGNAFTDALVKSFKLSFAKAESLKHTAESSKYRRQIFQAMRPVFADLVQELQRSIGFYSSTHRDAQIEKLVGVGNAFKLPGLEKYLHQNLGMTVEVPTAFQKVVANEAARAETLTDQFRGFPVAFGLALQGLDLTTVTSNLLPTEIAKQAVWRKKRPAFAAAAACLVLAGGLIWFRQASDTRALAAGAEIAMTIEVDDPDDVIENGARSPSAWGKAAEVREAAQALKKELRDRQGEGTEERAQTETLIELQQQKMLVPRVVELIHDAIPVVDGALGQAKSTTQVREAIAGAVPRAEREQVFIESLVMQFEPNLNAYGAWSASLTEVEPRINDDENAELPGLEIRVKCRTPNQGGAKFIADGFMNKLRQESRKAGNGFYFDRVWLISGNTLEASEDLGDGTSSGFSGGGWGGGRTSGSRADPGTALVDPVTLELAKDDWLFEVWLDVILEDYPELEEEDGGDEEED